MSRIPSKLHSIVLTEPEAALFSILRDCADDIHKDDPSKPRLVLRVAGGWVRDKLLGKLSDDIDIAIDKMEGEPFAHRLSQCMKAKGLDELRVATIQVNPEKSKHLETANARVLGYLVDFVNLRTETYSNDSRIPHVDFGSPLDDASRRDITINALFYNIHTGEVEDFLGTGLQDLADGYIRTPLPALQTFVDDPLRVLRVIRFASRFGYRIDDDILNTVKSEVVKEKFEEKITRERVGAEVHKMLKGPNPVLALRIIHDFGFYPVVFRAPTVPTAIEGGQDVDPSLSVAYAHVLERIFASPALQEMFAQSAKLKVCEEDQFLLYLTASVVPARGRTFLDRKKKTQSLSREILLTSLKLSAYESDVASDVLNGSLRAAAAIRRNEAAENGLDRRTLALLIRELGKPPVLSKWYLNVLLAWADEVVATSQLSDATVQSVAPKYIRFMRSIREFGIEDAQDFRPHLNGKEVAAHFGLRPGPEIGEYLNRLTEWQLGEPNATKEDCVRWLTAYGLEHPPTGPKITDSKKRKSK
ncbi:CCA tRNA nucleotidyltransferase, mitochondrial [Geranomyces variabilis]|nr:CCA tRNA nucleotidyltransferase, mitochondrial [Geranomyces variabilis]